MKCDIVDKIKERKEYLKTLPHVYNENPKLSVIVTSFNQKENIKKLVDSLHQSSEIEEIIICEDGSVDGSLEEWDSHLDFPNEFILRSNDLHEIRSTDRAIRMSRSDIFCIVQDDDEISHPSWVTEAMQIFNDDEKLGILGGMCGYFDMFDKQIFQHGGRKRFRDSADFNYVEHVNVGPFFVRKKYFDEIGGWDFKISKPGEMGMGFDHELGYRMWNSGYRVGHYVPFGFGNNEKKGSTYQLSGGEDARLSIQKERIEFLTNHLIEKYSQDKISEIGKLVKQLNLEMQ
jgi:glycosyltransferase involved in cell wall biosynthesis